MLRHLDEAITPLGGPVYRVTYMSRPTTLMEHPSTPEAIALLQWQSRKLNRLYGLTGALLVGRHWFVQALEGEPVPLFATLARINVDARHMDLRLFEVTKAPARLFGD
ncbi:MAG TPA: BLUF domain-containing protein [Salinarimonas sp.]|nr:BLUF domain-containing protein [Salinarimonas sp.]